MSMLINFVKSFARNEEGQDLLEYTLLVALIALDRDWRGRRRPAERVDDLHRTSPSKLSGSVVSDRTSVGRRVGAPAHRFRRDDRREESTSCLRQLLLPC